MKTRFSRGRLRIVGMPLTTTTAEEFSKLFEDATAQAFGPDAPCRVSHVKPVDPLSNGARLNLTIRRDRYVGKRKKHTAWGFRKSR